MEKMDVTKIHPFTKVVPMIYAYNTPGISYHDGWTKIGYTERQSVKDRINQQTHTANIKWELCWQDNAIYKDGSGEPFDDHDFHRYLTKEKGVEREPKTEWFRIDGDTSQLYFMKFAQNKYDIDIDGAEYILREPQEKAVEKTMEYFSQGGKEFLWNAKPRFGKTLTAYDLILRMNFKNVLIVTNRPSIGNSWADDFRKFIAHKGKLCFVSDTDSLKDVAGVMSRDEYMRKMEDPDDENWLGMVAFISLQDLKGSDNFGGKHRKLDWINEKHFDLIIVDESHEAADTYRSEIAFRHINYDHMLCLSGTPFKALAGGRYSENQIFNWSYADEQEAKRNWTGAGKNPYEDLPRLALFTYQLSDMIFDEVQRGVNLSDDETYDYAFDLNEFFSTNESGNFVHEDEVLKFIEALKTQEKYPFSTPELRNELKHTLWILNRVDSVNALARILRKDDVFGEAKSEYKIVIAAGDRKANESEDDANKSSLEKVRAAIAQNDKTITLSVGQLTVGVTVPEWSGVLMLQNMTSPSSYMQAAFRAQNPYATRNSDGQIIKKDTAYVFDFDPSRTLVIYDQFANNLSANRGSTTEERRANIERLINFFPVIGEDSEGKMVELDAEKVLTIPAKIKSTEVVRRGFISNLLFQNISNVFRAPSAVREIIEKLNPAYEEKPRKDQSLDGISDVPVGEDGNVEISNEIVIGTAQKLFGEKYYETVEVPLPEISEIDDEDKAKKVLDSYVSAVKDNIKENFIAPVIEEYDLTKRNVKSLEKEVSDRIDRKYEDVKSDYDISVTQAKNDYHSTLNDDTATDEEKSVAKDKFNEALNAANAKLFSDIQAVTQEISVEQPQSIVKKVEEFKAEEEKKGYEDKIKDHLRGFSRTIPSFIMAYGDENLTLANFDSYVSDDVFKDVTGITIDDFRFLRDGGDLTNDDGEVEHFEGQLFDETVFNSSVKEFLNKRKSLANYFDENQTEDIFCYIPPQRTNQIFTPKKVVKDMVDKLEEENPGCFDDPDATFADLYMKSGMYITEIVTRLFQSKRMKALYPDDAERLNHIFAKQVYGCAPTEIIYRICLRYILGFSDEIHIEKNNIRLCDTLEYAKNGTMEEEMRKVFEM